MRILVTGSRDWTRADIVYGALREAALDAFGEGTWGDPAEAPTIVVGDCPTGADLWAKLYADTRQWPLERHYADWDTHGRAAGPIRNLAMVNAGADLCLAFIGPCTSPRCRRTEQHDSHGASGCAQLAEKAGIETLRYYQ